jgi:hypothetical protein
MQHPDEGTIHSWLDGALAPDEAARVEAHVAECPECASAVAEARGFIAASSRILTKLDDVPAGVIPVARPIKRRNVVAWRAAAAVLVVAAGSLVVFQNRSTTEMAAISQPMATADTLSSPATALDAGSKASHPTQTAAVARKTAVPPVVTPDIAKVQPVSPTPAARDERRQDRAAAGSAVPEASRANSAVAPFAADAMAEAPLQLLREEKAIGGKRTLYTVAAGDTVWLFESAVTALQSVVTTGAATAAPSGRRTLSAPTVGELSASAPTVMADTAAPMSKTRGAAAQSASAKSAALSAPAAPAQAKPLNTISWMDATSGRVLTLSGRLPVGQLEDIKRRIERERAAAATRKPPQ